MSTGIGLPDWYNIKKAGAVSALGDLGELAARLGSIVTFDRRGDVLFLDSFEEGLLKWTTYLSGTGAAAALSHEAARTGGWCTKLTGGSTASCYAYIEHIIPYPVLGAMGFEFSWAQDDNLDELWVQLVLYDELSAHRATVVYDHVDGVIRYVDSAGVYQSLATGVSLYVAGYPFWTMKLVPDFEAQKYVRLVVNSAEYDLSGIGYHVAADVTTPHLAFSIQNKSKSGLNAVVYVDDVIITQNEP